MNPNSNKTKKSIKHSDKDVEINYSPEFRQDFSSYIELLSHESRNFYTSSRGFIDLALHHITDPKIRRFLENSRASIVRSAALVNNMSILMHFRLDDGYHLYLIDLLDVIDKCILEIHYQFPKKDIEFRIEDLTEKRFILADDHITQLLLNIMSNAVVYNNKGTVDVILKISEVKSKYILLEIIDFGSGILPEDREGIFDCFNKTTHTGKSVGLSLYVSKILMDRYDGKIEIQSRVPDDHQSGTCVKLLFNQPSRQLILKELRRED